MGLNDSSEISETSNDSTQSLKYGYVRLKTKFESLEKTSSETISRMEKEIDKLRSQQDLINRNIGNYDTSIEQNDERIEICFKSLEKKVDKDVHKLCEKGFSLEMENIKKNIDKDTASATNLSKVFEKLIDAKFGMQEKIVRLGWIATCVVIILWVAKSYFRG